MLAVVDTNIWVSAIINPTGPPAQVLAAYRGRRFALVTSEVMLGELREVLNRPRIALKYGIRAPDVDELVMSALVQKRVILGRPRRFLEVNRLSADLGAG